MEPAIRECLPRGSGVFQIPHHHRVTAQHQFADRRPIRRHRPHRRRIEHRGVLHHRRIHALPGHERGLLRQTHRLQRRLPQAHRRGTETFCQPVKVRHREPHLLHRGDHRRGRRRPTGRDLHGPVEPPPHGVRRMDQHRQHYRRAAHMCHVMIGDRRKDLRGIDPAQANMRAPGQRHGPRIGPSVAMEHR